MKGEHFRSKDSIKSAIRHLGLKNSDVESTECFKKGGMAPMPADKLHRLVKPCKKLPCPPTPHFNRGGLAHSEKQEERREVAEMVRNGKRGEREELRETRERIKMAKKERNELREREESGEKYKKGGVSGYSCGGTCKIVKKKYS